MIRSHNCSSIVISTTILNTWLLKHFVPETSLSMCVTHLYDNILGNNSLVQNELFSFELLEKNIANVDCHDVEQLDLDFCLCIILLNFGTHVSNIFRLLEQSCHGLFSSIHWLYVFLSCSFCFLQIFDSFGHRVPVCNYLRKGSQIVNFSFDPMI